MLCFEKVETEGFLSLTVESKVYLFWQKINEKIHKKAILCTFLPFFSRLRYNPRENPEEGGRSQTRRGRARAKIKGLPPPPSKTGRTEVQPAQSSIHYKTLTHSLLQYSKAQCIFPLTRQMCSKPRELRRSLQ